MILLVILVMITVSTGPVAVFIAVTTGEETLPEVSCMHACVCNEVENSVTKKYRDEMTGFRKDFHARNDSQLIWWNNVQPSRFDLLRLVINYMTSSMRSYPL
jgi:hypothetical protein